MDLGQLLAGRPVKRYLTKLEIKQVFNLSLWYDNRVYDRLSNKGTKYDRGAGCKVYTNEVFSFPTFTAIHPQKERFHSSRWGWGRVGGLRLWRALSDRPFLRKKLHPLKSSLRLKASVFVCRVLVRKSLTSSRLPAEYERRIAMVHIYLFTFESKPVFKDKPRLLFSS